MSRVFAVLGEACFVVRGATVGVRSLFCVFEPLCLEVVL